MVQQLSTNTFAAATWIVNTDATKGTHTTLATALTSASSGDTILLQSSVTENPTLKAGVNIFAALGSEQTPNVSITGKCTMTTAGTVTISGIRLTTNSDFFLAVTGSAASIVNLEKCYLNISNNTGISHSSSSASSLINCFDCSGNIGTTGIGVFTSTSAGNIDFQRCDIQNTGNSSTVSTVSTGVIKLEHTNFYSQITTSSVGSVSGYFSIVGTSNVNATGITLAGTGSGTCNCCNIQGGTASAASAGTGTSLVLNDCIINSSNTNAITGAGSITYSSLIYSGSSSKINTTTQTILPASSFQKIVTQVFTGAGTYTYTPTAGMKYCIAEVVGSGAGGAGCPLTGVGVVAAGGGGGAGGYARKTITAATIGTSQTVTIGAGGTGGTGNAAGNNGNTSSLGAIVTATGGTGGSNAGAAVVTTVNGNAGGTGGSGDVNIAGGAGGSSFGTFIGTTSAITSGFGGNSYFGAGGVAIAGTSTSNNGNAGQSYGSGGSGAANTASQGSARNGGNGADGIVIVTEYV